MKMDQKDSPVSAGALKLGYKGRESVRKRCSSSRHGKHRVSQVMIRINDEFMHRGWGP